MLSSIKFLAAILVIAVPLFYAARGPATAMAMSLADFQRRRNLWLMLTVAAFLSGSVWVYIGAGALLLAVAWRYEPRPLGLYLFLLLAVPPISAEIGAFGVVNQLFAIDHTRLLALFVLLPAAVVLVRREDTAPFGSMAADWCVAGYLLLLFLIQVMVNTLTASLRIGFYEFLGVFLPYYVASRLVRDLADFRDAMLSFFIAALLVAAIAICEFLTRKLFYSPLPEVWGVFSLFGRYLSRGDWLRTMASTAHPIVLGYVMAVALGMAIYLRKSIPVMSWMLGVMILVGGLLVSLSRGPWIGYVVILAVYIASARKPVERMAIPLLFLTLLAPILIVNPVSDKYLDYLPFIGSIDAENVDYRHKLLEVSLDVIADNPWFGYYHFLDDMRMQTLLQGENIIDVVNTYLGITLHSGLIGLGLVLGTFGSVLKGIFREMRRPEDRESEESRLGRVLFATLAGILVIIFTTSSIGVIPLIYWTVGGLGAAYVRMQTQKGFALRQSPTDVPYSPVTTRYP